LGMIQKQGNWVPYELKLRNVERRFFTCEMLLARHKRKGFLHHISLVMKNGSTTIIQKRGNHGDYLAMLQQPSRMFMEKNSCCVFGGISLVYELLKPNETITEALYRTQLMRLSRALKEKRAHYYSRHDKIILLHDNA